MQRRALKQLGKVTQWTNEKVFSGEKTQLSDDFTDFEKDIELRRLGVERLHATSFPFFQQVTKVKQTADPFPPAGSKKDKILLTEALGLVMIDYGGDVGDTYGDGLAKYGRARCKLAVAQEEFGQRLSENYIAGMEAALAAVNDYKVFRKKLDSRRLALDSAITRAQGSKKDSRSVEEDVALAQFRFEEVEKETQARMMTIQAQEEQQWLELSDLLGAELDYFTKCKAILEELRESWPNSSGTRPRAKSNASVRSNRPKLARLASEESDHNANRSRSQSNASSTKGKEKRLLPSLGPFGKKGLSMAGKSKSFTKYGNIDDGLGQPLHSDEEEASNSSLPLSPKRAAPPIRRVHTTPLHTVKTVRALFDFAGEGTDELPLHIGQIVELQKEVSEDWWIGESEGRSGLFPSTYCELYTLPASPKRTVAELLSQPIDLTSDSEASDGFSDSENHEVPLTAQPARPTKKPAPPPPPTRRSASSNFLTSHDMSPPKPPFPRARSNIASRPPILDSSPEGSPFAGSDEERNDGGASRGLSRGLATTHLLQDSADHGACAACGCEDFTQNVFKAKGMCSTCYHLH